MPRRRGRPRSIFPYRGRTVRARLRVAGRGKDFFPFSRLFPLKNFESLLISSADGHISFVRHDLLSVRTEDIPDKFIRESCGPAVGDHVEVTGDWIGPVLDARKTRCNDLVG